MVTEEISISRRIIDKSPANDPYGMQKKLLKAQHSDGLKLFCNAAYSAFPAQKLPTDTPETFVLNHPDLNFQNIFVDTNGKITGIIDWQGTRAPPRPIGYASLPLCLRPDWEPNYSPDHWLPPWVLASYRDDYVRHMTEALSSTPSQDVQITRHSDWYWFAASTVMGYADQTLEDLATRMMKEVSWLRGFQGRNAFLVFLEKGGKGSRAFEMLKKEVEKMYAPT